MAQGFTLWLTGLAASGKTELADRLEEALLERGLDVEKIDEGEIRQQWLAALGFEKQEGDGLVRFLGHVCNLLTRNGVITIAAALSPCLEIRNELRSQIGNFVEVYLKCPVEACEEKDTSGNYQRARAGELKGFAGVDAPYEEPVQPEILLETEQADVEESTKTVLKTLEIMELIPKVSGDDYNEEEEQKITKRLKDLGYI